METLEPTLQRLQHQLLSLRHQGHWTGRLSSSALATATAVFALAAVKRNPRTPEIEAGLTWLARHQNQDGGWGDTPRSQSNLSTTLLVYSVLTVTSPSPSVLPACEAYLRQQAGSLEPASLAQAIQQSYGSDRSFSSPILTMAALAGRLGAKGWFLVPALPFELALLPASWFKWLRLPVVSYALPALIAIGQVAFHHHRPRFPLTRMLRYCSRRKTLERLIRLQPDNGGFLEAIPLTAFVVMSLAHCDQHDHPVTQQGRQFLLQSQRDDGSWPIDTNLATWVSTLAIEALGPDIFNPDDKQSLVTWLLQTQHRRRHPYTQADPGGWAWTDLPGAVPDADDTPGVLLALKSLDPDGRQCHEAVTLAIQWLLDLQNRDGGIPTFCRGWGKLPFDRSCADLTAHTLAAWSVWLDVLTRPLQQRVDHACHRALDFLKNIQQPDGSWCPLWFGNEHVSDLSNPVYGTARILTYLTHLPPTAQSDIQTSRDRALQWLLNAQHSDGTWGGNRYAPATIEETALALEALASQSHGLDHTDQLHRAIRRGTQALLQHLGVEDSPTPQPIGLYFARLWYYEQLYPLTFSLRALRQVQQLSMDQTITPA